MIASAPTIRRARRDDLDAMIALLADDPLGRAREDPQVPAAAAYVHAFDAIDADPHQILAVAEREGRVVGMLQLTVIPGLSRRGAWRGQIESVRVARTERRTGLGRVLFEWAIAESRLRGCALVQLTTDATRTDAHAFYDSLGFEASHVGYKRALGD